jgi:hypothetical protein
MSSYQVQCKVDYNISIFNSFYNFEEIQIEIMVLVLLKEALNLASHEGFEAIDLSIRSFLSE